MMGAALLGLLLLLLGIVLLWLSQRTRGAAAQRSQDWVERSLKPGPAVQILAERELSRALRKPVVQGLDCRPAGPEHQCAPAPANAPPRDDASGNGGSSEVRTAAAASDAAHCFMRWITSGLADGSIRVNASGAMVHFVGEGMLLVSPRIFKAYAGSRSAACQVLDEREGAAGADGARWIQREVLRAGWHVQGEDGGDFKEYSVTRGGRGASRLCGVLIRDPARFVSPLPPANPILSPLNTQAGPSA